VSRQRRLVERVLRTSLARRGLAAIRRGSGLDADLAELAARVERLERIAASEPGAPQLSTTRTSKAWASSRDADLLEEILGAAAERAG
jgi:ribosomal protein S12 methylthiotransferase accessory factor YcaO